jgi:hypothetical protein
METLSRHVQICETPIKIFIILTKKRDQSSGMNLLKILTEDRHP